MVNLEHGKPLVFGKEQEKGIRLNGFTPEVVSIKEGQYSVSDLLVHNENDLTLAFILANMIHDPALPRPMGIFVSLVRPTYEEQLRDQVARAKSRKGNVTLQQVLDGDETWVIQ